MELLRERSEDAEHYRAFRAMNETYFAAFERGETEAIAAMIDFYGGAGTYASWPAARARLRRGDDGGQHPRLGDRLRLPADRRRCWRPSRTPTLVLWGGASHPAAQRANALLGQSLPGASMGTVDGAAHFMIATHAAEVARLVSNHIQDVEGGR